MATIHSDLHIEILVRLPTKLVVRLKSVCKRWRSLISSRNFCLLHTLRHRHSKATAPGLLFRDHLLYNLEAPPNPITLPARVIQSCNGLLLCRFPENAPADYCVYNLATGLHRVLDVVHNDNVVCLALAFDPSLSPYYKLVCVRCIPDPFYQISVFDSESSLWSIVLENFSGPDEDVKVFEWRDLVYWNNAIHWVSLIIGGSLFYFDIGKGTIGQVPRVSTSPLDGPYWQFLLESGGYLHCIIHSCPYFGPAKLTVFEMERDHSKWSLKYEGEYDDTCVVSVMSILRMRDEEDLFLVFEVSGNLRLCNLKNFQELIGGLNEWEQKEPLDILPKDIHQFVETLAPV